MLLTVGVILTAITLLGLGAFVLARSSASAINRPFGIFTIVLTVWMVVNFLGANFKSNPLAVYFLYADFITGPSAIYLYWRFTCRLYVLACGKKVYNKSLSIALLLVAFISTVIPLTGLMVGTQRINGVLSIEYKSLYGLYSVLLGVTAVAGLVNLIRALQIAKGSLKQQVKTMLWGLGIALVLIVIANLIVPQLTTSRTVNLLAGNLSYIGLVVFIALTTYAIVKHRLFDIRLVVARSLAYILAISFLVTTYSVLGYLLTERIFESNNNPTTRFIVTTSLLIITALTFSRIKLFFDRITNRLFYQDAYDAQALLSQLNQQLVSTYQVDSLLNQTAELIARELKAGSVTFIIASDDSEKFRTFGSMKHVTDDLRHVYKMIVENSKTSIFIADELDESHSLRHNMRSVNTAIAIKLTASHANKQEIGLLTLGDKRSGNPYTQADIEVLEIIANELVIAIQNALRFEEIENFNITLQEKVENATRQLRRTNEKLKMLDETKDEFISMASHQLRTPLTAVKGYLSMVIEGDAGPLNEMQEKLLTQAFTSSQRMVYLIADLLNVSRLHTGKFIIEKTPSNLAEVIESEISQLKETAAARNIKLKFVKPAKFPALMLDETKTRQVIMNFMDNAIYYGKPGGRIDVGLKDTGKSVEFTVTDDGIGVPKAEQHHLFTKFYRAVNAKKARPDGTGLGLFMAKKVIVAQGGALIFHSQEDKGSTFGFSFGKEKLQPPTTIA